MHKTHISIEVDSAQRNSGTAGQFEYLLSTAATFDRNNKGRQYFVRMENIRVPMTFYQVFSKNNVLNITEDPAGTPDTFSVTVPEGNYTESELRTTIISLLNAATLNANTYNITFDEKTGKYTITSDTTEFRINDITTSGSTINRIIGFADATYTSSSLSLTSVNHILLVPRRYLTLETDISTHGHLSPSGNNRVIAHIPILENRSFAQFFENKDGPLIKLNGRNPLNAINFHFKDADNHNVDFNGVDWSGELVVYEFRGI